MSGDPGNARVVPYADLAAAIRAASSLLGDCRLVVVDGPSGSGKTTFAQRLAGALGGAPVVHLDDVYDGWDGPLGTALVQRLHAWLLLPWRDGLPGRHPVYDWSAGAYRSWREAPAAPVVVLEGVGAAQAGLREHAVLVCWVEAAEEVRPDRVVRRDGPAVEGPLAGWREREASHFAADGTRAAAAVLVDGHPAAAHDVAREFVTLPG
ncbi:MAG: hypothetical protein R2737_06800 [Candidatus Nanopelagicales bacterium]